MPPRLNSHVEGEIPPPPPPPPPGRLNRAGKVVGNTLAGMCVGALVGGPIGLVAGGIFMGGTAAATGPRGGEQRHPSPGPPPEGAPLHHHPGGPPPGQPLSDSNTPPPERQHHHPPGGPPPGQPLPDSNAVVQRVVATPEEAPVQASAPPVIEATAQADPASSAATKYKQTSFAQN